MTINRTTGPNCAVVWNLINIHIHLALEKPRENYAENQKDPHCHIRIMVSFFFLLSYSFLCTCVPHAVTLLLLFPR